MTMGQEYAECWCCCHDGVRLIRLIGVSGVSNPFFFLPFAAMLPKTNQRGMPLVYKLAQPRLSIRGAKIGVNKSAEDRPAVENSMHCILRPLANGSIGEQ